MARVTQSDFRLIVKSFRWSNPTPLAYWISSGVLTVVGIVLMAWRPLISEVFKRCDGPFCDNLQTVADLIEQQDSQRTQVLGEVLGTVLLLGGVGSVVLGKWDACIFDKTTSQVILKLNGVFDRGQMRRPLGDIEGIQVINKSTSDGSPIYRGILILKNSQPRHLPISRNYSSDADAEEKTASTIRSFLNLPDLNHADAMDDFKSRMWL